MKRFVLLLMISLSISVSAQNKKNVSSTKTVSPVNVVSIKPSKSDSLLVKFDSLLTQMEYLMRMNNTMLEQLDINTSLKGRYKLYPTENIYTLLELDTKTGKIKQVQWSLDSDKEGSMTINDTDFSYGLGYGSGSFELYPTQNMYQFIMIDKTDGRKWHVQWGIGESKRWIRRIF